MDGIGIQDEKSFRKGNAQLRPVFQVTNGYVRVSQIALGLVSSFSSAQAE
jgi:hypothetical protein